MIHGGRGTIEVRLRLPDPNTGYVGERQSTLAIFLAPARPVLMEGSATFFPRFFARRSAFFSTPKLCQSHPSGLIP